MVLFTHHLHSGQFCTHAECSLEEIILAAILRGMTSICLTEHIPRHPIDFYPAEESHPLLAGGNNLFQVFTAYHAEAQRLRNIYSARIQILIGFESEWIDAERTLETIRSLQAQHDFDMFIGSVHHVHGIPIDFDDAEYWRARTAAGGTDEDVAVAYFDAQLEMLQALRPPIVGHFDLIRLKADVQNRDRDWRTWDERVWSRIVRNLEFVREYGGVLEVNSAALRKGLEDVYPRREIMECWDRMGGRFTLSDDSHGVAQLCTNYGRALECVARAGVEHLWWAHKGDGGLEWRRVDVMDVNVK